MSFNDSMLKVSYLFNMWSGLQFSLAILCRATGSLIAEDGAGVQDL
jgi:hypothetical protein